MSRRNVWKGGGSASIGSRLTGRRLVLLNISVNVSLIESLFLELRASRSIFFFFDRVDIFE